MSEGRIFRAKADPCSSARVAVELMIARPVSTACVSAQVSQSHTENINESHHPNSPFKSHLKDPPYACFDIGNSGAPAGRFAAPVSERAPWTHQWNARDLSARGSSVGMQLCGHEQR